MPSCKWASRANAHRAKCSPEQTGSPLGFRTNTFVQMHENTHLADSPCEFHPQLGMKSAQQGPSPTPVHPAARQQSCRSGCQPNVRWCAVGASKQQQLALHAEPMYCQPAGESNYCECSMQRWPSQRKIKEKSTHFGNHNRRLQT